VSANDDVDGVDAVFGRGEEGSFAMRAEGLGARVGMAG
jgi:hypothetical protein